MNTTQIKCFLTVAETLNFTKAAQQLYMTQPGLSRYIVSLERELNTLLFIRDHQHVRLTPAGVVLANELSDFNSKLEEIVLKVQKIGEGYSGSLSIGTLAGQWLDDDFNDKMARFIQKNPNIDISLEQGSFSDLREWLIQGKIDIAWTLIFDIKDMADVIYEAYDEDIPVIAISRHRPLGRKKNITFEEMLMEPFICISPDDSRAGYEMVMNTFKFRGPSDVSIAPNLPTVMMRIEAGQGVGIINTKSSIMHNSSIVTVPMPSDSGGAASCFAWLKSNMNPAVSMFTTEFISLKK